MKVITETHRHWKGQPISSINFEKLGKYLGPHINHADKDELQRKLWKIYFYTLKDLRNCASRSSKKCELCQRDNLQ